MGGAATEKVVTAAHAGPARPARETALPMAGPEATPSTDLQGLAEGLLERLRARGFEHAQVQAGEERRC